MRKLFVYLKAYRKESILGPLFKLAEASLELVVPLVVATMIDRGIKQNDNGYIIGCGIFLAALGLIGFLSSITAQFFAAKASVGFVTKLKSVLFAHMQQFSYQEIDCLGVSTMISRMSSDMNQIQTGLNLTLRLLLRSPFIVFGAMVMAFTIDVKMALIFAVVIPVLLVVVFSIMLVCIPLYGKVQKKLDEVVKTTRGNLNGARVIRAFGAESQEISDFEEENRALNTMQNKVGRISALLNPLTYVIINFFIILLIYKGAVFVNSGTLTQGEVVALYNYMSIILVELIKLANLIINITKSIASAKRVQSVLDRSAGEDGEECLGNFVLERIETVSFQNCSLHYSQAGEESLSEICFDVKKGEILGIIGGTGSGKTSLVHLLPRFYKTTEGSVLVNGTNVNCISVETLRSHIGVVPQKAVLFRGTIRDNLKWGNPQATDEELMEALEAAQIKDFVVGHKEGLSARVEQDGKNFSGGQRQRLTIARALLRKPDVLILDDSFSALDFVTESSLRRSIAALPFHPMVFIVSQRASSILHADKIVVMEDGKAVGVGTHQELLSKCEVYREIYESQFEKDTKDSQEGAGS